MSHLLLEFRLLRQDLLKAGILTTISAALATVLFFSGGGAYDRSSSSDVLVSIFGSVTFPSLAWMYWILFCVSYLVALQFIWKPSLHKFEIYQLLRYRSVRRYWSIKLAIAYLFTLFHVLVYFACVILACSLNDLLIYWDYRWLIALICITISFYLHALLWLWIRLLFSAEAASLIVIALFYLGLRITEPYIPLYYSMFNHVHSFGLVIVSELAVAGLLVWRIWRRAEKVDYI